MNFKKIFVISAIVVILCTGMGSTVVARDETEDPPCWSIKVGE